MAPRVVATAVKPGAGGFQGGRVGDSKRSGAHTREPASRDGRGRGRERWRLVAALGPWGAGIDLLGPPSPPGISPRPR